MSVDLTKGATVELVKTLSDDLRLKSDGTKWTSAGAAIRAHDTEIFNVKSTIEQNLYLLTNEHIYTVQSGWQTFEYTIKDGGTYIATISNNDMSVYASTDGLTNAYRITAGTAFVANQTTTYIRVWSPSTQTVSIIAKNLKIEIIETEINKLSSDSEILHQTVDGIISGFQLDENDFEKGAITATGGNDSYRALCRCRNKQIVSYPFDIVVTTSVDNCKIFVAYYDNNGVYLSNSGWQTDYTINASSRFRIMIDGLYNMTASELTISEILAKISTTSASMSSLQNQIISTKNATDTIALDLDKTKSIIFTKRFPHSIWERGSVDKTTAMIINYRASSRISTILTSAEPLTVYFGNLVVYMVDLDSATDLVAWKKGTFIIPANIKIGITVAISSTDTSNVDTGTLLKNVFVVNDIFTTERYGKGMQSIARLGYDIDNTDTPPEMSVLSYQEAYIHGFRIMLTDVVWTSDLVPVCIHDATINRVARNADGTEISESITPSSKTFAELNQYDYGIYKGKLYVGTKLPTLEQIAFWCKRNACELYLEIRPATVTASMAQSLCDILAKYGMIKYCTFIVANADTMDEIINYAGKQRIGVVLAQNYTDSQNISLIDDILSLNNSGNDAFAYYYSLPMSADMVSDTVYQYLVANHITAEFTEVRSAAYLTAFLGYEKIKIFSRVAVRPNPIGYEVF